jgi:zeaxanthin glucosyltransferase
MKHFAILAHSAIGHLNPMIALAKRLEARGNRVTFLQVLDVRTVVESAGLKFIPIGVSEYPLGEIPRLHEMQGMLGGLAAFRFTLAKLQRQAALYLREVPPILESERVDGLIADQLILAAGSIADALGLPFVTVSVTVTIHDCDDRVPPLNTGWSYSQSPLARMRNRAAYGAFHYLSAPVRNAVNDYRRSHGLKEAKRNQDFLSNLAQIHQLPEIVEFPRRGLPDCFHVLGPFIDSQARPPVEFPWSRLNGDPLIYASLGTLQNRQLGIFRMIAEACSGLKAQLVISLGGGAEPSDLGTVPGTPIVVRFAPQLDLLARARLVITHCGVNTFLESLVNGVPIVGIPIANDQPAEAARVKWAGVGEILPFRKATAARLRPLIEKVLTQDRYRQRALEIGRVMAGIPALDAAASVIEQALGTGLPVPAGPRVHAQQTTA